MGVTNANGEIGEAMVLADLPRKGHGVAIPFGHDLRFDLILIRKSSSELERVQCKYTESDGRVIDVRCASSSAWVRHTYSAAEVDWIAVYDATTSRCYYVHSSTWAGLTRPTLRLVPAANGQKRGVRLASAHPYPERTNEVVAERMTSLAMLNDPSPE